MKRGKNLLARIPVLADLPAEPLPGQSVVELLGESRVLVEKHLGVCQYCGQCVSVRMGFGTICVHGSGLELMHMSKDQLVISGKIENIAVNRKG